MAANGSSRRISLPAIGRIALHNFDLYSREPNAEVTFDKNVFCLIGANGLGKSTFLNTVNYAITGAVPDPSRAFLSAADYLKNASRRDRTEDYYSGRVSEDARPIAGVTAELRWPTCEVTLTRELFGSQGISELKIQPSDGEGAVYRLGDGISSEELKAKYEGVVLGLSCLEDFAQFVFLLHFVSTFDEGRHLIAWDDGALTNALYLAFGTDPAAAKKADQLQRDMERESSRARNVRFAARGATDRINQLRDVLDKEHVVDPRQLLEVRAEFDLLTKNLDYSEQRTRTKLLELRDVDVAWTDLSSQLTEMQLEYRQLFSSRLGKVDVTAFHPVIRASISEDRCAICGAAHIGAVIQKSVENDECPLCHSEVAPSDDAPGQLEALRNLDKEIVRVRNDLAKLLATRDRVQAEYSASLEAEQASRLAFSDFENRERDTLRNIDVSGDLSLVKQEVIRLEKEFDDLISQSDQHYKNRDRIRQELLNYEKNLRAEYEAAAESFVPRFRSLAEAFVGLPVDVDLSHLRGSTRSGFSLRIRLDDQLRVRPDQLSESQRFFIDIALRMALAEHVSDSPATLLIDTPEGSLDIAYEARAGSMFSMFVEDKNSIIMTANLRSSQLVLRLADLCKKDKMSIVRMTDWTDLTEVQLTEDKLFKAAYSQIEDALL